MHYTQALRGFQCFLFDLDGTLLDSMPLWDKVYLQTLAHFGISVPADYLMHVNHLSVRDGAVYTVQSLGLDTTPEEIIRIWASLGTAAYRDSIQLKPHAADLLRLLRADGKTLGIATALGKGFFESCLARNGVLSLFSDSTSVEEVGRGKDSPAIYLRACEKAGAAPGESDRCDQRQAGRLFCGRRVRCFRRGTARRHDPHRRSVHHGLPGSAV